jgi:hypothetical protein
MIKFHEKILIHHINVNKFVFDSNLLAYTIPMKNNWIAVDKSHYFVLKRINDCNL